MIMTIMIEQVIYSNILHGSRYAQFWVVDMIPLVHCRRIVIWRGAAFKKNNFHIYSDSILSSLIDKCFNTFRTILKFVHA